MNAATIHAGLPVPGDARAYAAIIPVYPGAVSAGLFVAPRVGKAPMIAPVRALLAVGRQAQGVVVQVILAVCIGEDKKEEEEGRRKRG